MKKAVLKEARNSETMTAICEYVLNHLKQRAADGLIQPIRREIVDQMEFEQPIEAFYFMSRLAEEFIEGEAEKMVRKMVKEMFPSMFSSIEEDIHKHAPGERCTRCGEVHNPAPAEDGNPMSAISEDMAHASGQANNKSEEAATPVSRLRRTH